MGVAIPATVLLWLRILVKAQVMSCFLQAKAYSVTEEQSTDITVQTRSCEADIDCNIEA